ncbi:MAG: ATP-binding protein [Peptostreptococcaceae bacterium]|jgi:hypothetical protein|nr:ATP-binding protein [Peptostreptococcaceae bacterium]
MLNKTELVYANLNDVENLLNGKTNKIDSTAILTNLGIISAIILNPNLANNIGQSCTILGFTVSANSIKYILDRIKIFKKKKSGEEEAEENYKKYQMAEYMISKIAIQRAINDFVDPKNRIFGRWTVNKEIENDIKNNIKEVEQNNKEIECEYLKDIDDKKQNVHELYWTKIVDKVFECINCEDENINKKELMSSITKRYEKYSKHIKYKSSLYLNYLGESNLKEKISIKYIQGKIDNLNETYMYDFKYINDELYNRNIFSDCIDVLKNQKSLMIHGKAGVGKSSSTIALINYCKGQGIPYLAIKLDRKQPKMSSSHWSEELGFEDSISYMLDIISEDKQAVIILDQLDALRWTQAHSSDALGVCRELIKEVTDLNMDRTNKISIVFVCRTYDLKNDNSLKSLYKDDNSMWKEVEIKELDEKSVKEFVGSIYDSLNKKLKALLKIPSNLYIFKNLDVNTDYKNISTTKDLINKWWVCLEGEAKKKNIDLKYIQEIRDKLVEKLEKNAVLVISESKLGSRISSEALGFLISNNFIIRTKSDKKNKEEISFMHQSIFDYLVLQSMQEKYDDGEDLVNIIGDMKRQDLIKRYQVKMFLQLIYEEGIEGLLEVGEELFESEEIRFCIRFLFIEILNEYSENEYIQDFILDKIEDEYWQPYLLENIIFNNIKLVELMIERKIIDNWMNNNELKSYLGRIFFGFRNNLTKNIVDWIRKYIFLSEENTKLFLRIFDYNILKDKDFVLDLRLELYERYPKLYEGIINFKELCKRNKQQTIKLLKILIKNKIISRMSHIYVDENDIIDYEIAKVIIEELIPIISTSKKYYDIYKYWDAQRHNESSQCRACISLLKKANKTIIENEPELFLESYQKFMGKGYIIFNEIILEGLLILPVEYSNIVIDYIYENLNSDNILDKTSKAESKIELILLIAKKHSKYCDIDKYKKLECKINKFIYYNSNNSYTKYENIYKYKASLDHTTLLLEVLKYLYEKRISKKSKDLIRFLENKYNKKNYSKKKIVELDVGFKPEVSSLIGCKLSDRKWIDLLIGNDKKRKKRKIRINKDYWIDDSLSNIADYFNKKVKENPKRFINLFLNMNNKTVINIEEIFIEDFFRALEFSEKLDSIEQELLEKIILKYTCYEQINRMKYICGIIEKLKHIKWSKNIIKTIKDILIKYDYILEDEEDTFPDKKDSNNFLDNSINCLRGQAICAMKRLIVDNNKLYYEFKDIILKLLDDKNDNIKFTSLYLMNFVIKDNEKLAYDKIREIYINNENFIEHNNSNYFLSNLYKEYKNEVLQIIKKAYNSNIKNVKRNAIILITMFYIKYDEFEDVFEESNIINMSKECADYSLEVLIDFFDKAEYKEKVKQSILKYKDIQFDQSFYIEKLFLEGRIDLKKDRNFLIDVVKFKKNKRLVEYFVEYISDNSISVMDFKEIIISLVENIINNSKDSDYSIYYISDEISKLILSLYEETKNKKEKINKKTNIKCMDIIDTMFENQIGLTRKFAEELLEI